MIIQPETSGAQHYISRTYTEADGLYSSMVLDLVQDSTGVIWIARRSGISSYDGMTFFNYNIADGLKPNTYSCLCIDEKGKLWALPETGDLCVSVYNGSLWETFSGHNDYDLRYGTTFTSFDVFYENNKAVCVAGSERDGLFVLKDSVWKRYIKENGLISDIIHGIAHRGSDIYVATGKGLSIIRNQTIENNPRVYSAIPPGEILAMAHDNDKIWVLGNNWLGYLSGNRFELTTRGFLLPVNVFWSHCFLYPDGAGNIYFGNPYFVFSFSEKQHQIESYGRANGLISEGGTSALVDRERNVWISGYRGITKIGSKRFVSYSKSDGLYRDEVASGLEIRPGHYVFGHDCALTYLDGSTFSHLILDPVHFKGNFETRVLDLDKDPSGNLWMAVSALGLAKVDRYRKIQWFREKQGLSGIAYSVAVNPSGKIYAGTSSGLFEMVGDTFIALRNLNLPKVGIRKIIPETDYSLMLATMNAGLIQVRGQRSYSYLPENPVRARNVFSFFTDKESRKWVGTTAGLYILKDSALNKVDDNGLRIDRPVFTIVSDTTGNLWFGTDNGLFRWDGAKMDHITTTEGLSGLEINRDACFRDHLNHLWFGTNNGLTIFFPEYDYDLEKIPAPRVNLISVEAGNGRFGPDHDLELSSDQNNLVFTFRIISFINEKKVSYQYMLENFDTAWSNEMLYKDNKLRFTNLRPGTYRLQLRACNALGIWSQPVRSAIIIIDQPFWLRWWFIGSLVLFLGGIIFLSGRFILVTRYNLKLEKIVAERTAELRESNAAKDNFFSIIAHDLKNPFHVMLGMVDLLTRESSEYSEEERKQMIGRLKSTLSRTTNLLENLLTWGRSQKGLIPFNPEKLEVSNLIDEEISNLEPAAYKKKIDLKRTGDPNLWVWADCNMVQTIIRNLVSNAIKFTSPGGAVIVAASLKTPGSVEISVRDNGCGMSLKIREKLFKIDQRTVTKGTQGETGTGLGLILCKDFVGKNHGTIEVISEEGQGSTFNVKLPVWNNKDDIQRS